MTHSISSYFSGKCFFDTLPRFSFHVDNLYLLSKNPLISIHRDERGNSRYHSISCVYSPFINMAKNRMHSLPSITGSPAQTYSSFSWVLQGQFSKMGYCLTPTDSSLIPYFTYSSFSSQYTMNYLQVSF